MISDDCFFFIGELLSVLFRLGNAILGFFAYDCFFVCGKTCSVIRSVFQRACDLACVHSATQSHAADKSIAVSFSRFLPEQTIEYLIQISFRFFLVTQNFGPGFLFFVGQLLTERREKLARDFFSAFRQYVDAEIR